MNLDFIRLIVFMHSISAGYRLSENDLQGMRDIFQNIIQRNILQNLSKLISACTQEVINKRRGIANALFGWFRSGSSASMSAMGNTSDNLHLYHSETIEFRIRFIADMAFLVKVGCDEGMRE